MDRLKILHLSWIIGLILLAVIIFHYKSESTVFYGITESREIAVNSEYAVELKQIHVMPGQVISRGELLVELDRPELTLEINKISHQLEELETENIINTNTLKSRINELKAQKASKQSEINYQIRQMQAQYDINKELSAKLTSVVKDKRDDTKTNDQNGMSNPIELKIESLKKALELEVNPIQINIDMLEEEMSSPENPVQVKIKSLKRELELLSEEKRKLEIYAAVTGIVGSVNFKPGEKISPFTTILTLHTKSPSLVKGYIHENVYNRVSVAHEVKIVSLASKNNAVMGEVVGVGSRIVECPERLRKSPELRIWGREVLIKIPEDNRFLLGEKVLISSPHIEKRLYRAIRQSLFPKRDISAPCEDKFGIGQKSSPKISEITVSERLNESSSIEASGAVYLEDLKRYLVISDRTTNDRALLYLMNDEGKIEASVPILGLLQIRDMEAVTTDNAGNIYVACSQSTEGKGQLPDKRKLLVRVKRKGVVFRLDKKVYLYDLLQAAARQNQEARWARIMSANDGNLKINIEGIFCWEGCLYLGFKSPLRDGKAVILRIENIETVFAENRLNEKSVAIWREFDLRDRELNIPGGISDLCLWRNKLLILSYAAGKRGGVKERAGCLWTYDLNRDDFALIWRFADLKPEGVAYNSDVQRFLIVFDYDGNEPSSFTKIRIPQ